MLAETENRNKTQNIIDWGGMGGGQFSVAIKKLEKKHGNRKKNKEERGEREKEREKEEKRTFLCNFWIFWVLLGQPYCKQYRAHGHVGPCDLIIVPDWCTEVD